MTRLVIIQGAPAVGKTTLSRKIAGQLNIGVIAKDDFKELLYDKLGKPVDRDQSRIYGTAVMDAMFVLSRKLLEGGIDHILESAFHPEIADRDFKKLLNSLDIKVVQLYCFTTPEVQQERYRRRLQEGTRHPGHPDKPKDTDEFIKYNQRYTKLDVEPCVDVDTTEFGDDDFSKLMRTIKQELEEKT